MIRLTRQGTVFSESAAKLQELQAVFASRHYLRFPALLDAELLDFIQLQVDHGEFQERVHEGIASNKELCLSGNAAFGALLFLMNDEELFQLIQDLTGCERIRCFAGRIYRINPGQGHHDSWHNDIGEDRLVGMSINLSREAYGGGVLQMRDRDSKEIVGEVDNVGPGDAVIFRLSPRLQHRITEVEGATSKTAFAGWFRANPDFSSLLREFYQEPATSEIHQMTFPARD
jgi:hypothetical protein